LAEIEAAPHQAMMTAAVRVAIDRKPEGLTEALLACLPWVEDESGVEAIFGALNKVAVKDASATEPILAAADDKLAIRRAAAAHALGHCTKEQRKLATKMLGDTDAQVRFHAAASLLRSREPDSVPALAAVLTDGPLALAWQAEDMLFRVAGEKGPAVTLGSGGE